MLRNIFDLFDIPFTLSSYALLIMLGYLVGVTIATRLGKKRALPKEPLVSLSFWLIVAGIVGGRLGDLLVHAGFYVDLCFDPSAIAPPFGECLDLLDCPQGTVCTDGACAIAPDCTAALRIWEGGSVFYGGLILALVAFVWYARRRKLPLATTADAFAPALAIGHAFGRIGCFLEGCCFGKPTTWATGVSFPQVDGGPVHPTQLYEAVALFVIGIVLVIMAARSPKPRASGRIFLWYVVLYAPTRFVIETFRGDGDRGSLLDLPWAWYNHLIGAPSDAMTFLSTSQVVSLVGLVVAIVGLVLVRRRGHAVSNPLDNAQ